MDLADYTMRMLLEIDQLVYTSGDLGDFTSIEEEYDHVGIGNDRVAVVCRDPSGIYEVEQRLRSTWGDELGIVALEKEPGSYTLRRAAALSNIDLKRAYARLNLLDPAVNGRPPEQRWGGSDEIGGSPRPSGTKLTPKEIAAILRDSFRPPRGLEQAQHMLGAVVATLGLVVLLGFAMHFARAGGVAATWARPVDWAVAAGLTAGLGLLLLRLASGGRHWLFGLRRPAAAHDGWLVAPAVLGGALLGAGWTPRDHGASITLALTIAVAASLAVEIWFRGFIHGLFVLDAPIQHPGGRWFVSRANAVSALLYAAVTAFAGLFLLAPSPFVLPADTWGLAAFVGALVAGLALGVIRERTLSVWPGVALQIAAGLLLAALQ
jgi:hypothetical protein